ncbi:hypothetical protein QQS21_010107 [Conoideocrella luteorostrata]|uniref:Uncharacterized protein n=1 Tax=Conoideocrella luteorostrata TaxID=1105319 RepID=A0AAJ0CI17_9HYPO|nr:hypothetical protein QQS21_010107 [Conoideocrella luteorostrata]
MGNALPGIHRLSGNPIFGRLFDFLGLSLPDMVDKLIQVAGDDGVAYFWAGPSVVVQLSDLQLVKELLVKPDESLSELFHFVIPFADKHVKRLAALGYNEERISLRQYVERYAADLWRSLFYDVEEGQVDIMSILPAIDAPFQQFGHPASNTASGQLLGIWVTVFRPITTSLVCFKTYSSKDWGSMLTNGRLSASYLWKISPEKHDTNPCGLSDLAVDLARFSIVGGVQGFRQVVPWAILKLSRHRELLPESSR